MQFSVQKSAKAVVNPDIEKESAKVVHSYDIEDIGEKAAFCRCWRSKKVRCFFFGVYVLLLSQMANFHTFILTHCSLYP
jgi:predicted AlkP superfamily pyrophosphatase or phosphodiesterase